MSFTGNTLQLRSSRGRKGNGIGRLGGLRTPILILIVLAIGPLLIGRFWQISREADLAVETARERARGLAAQAAEQHEELIARAQTFLQVLVRVPAVRDGLVDQCHILLRDLARQASWQRRLWIVRPDGRAICSSQFAVPDLNVADRDYFQRALATRQFVVSDYVKTKVTNESALIAAVPAVDEDGTVEFVAMATLEVQRPGRSSNTVEQEDHARILLDSAGIVVAWRPSSRAVDEPDTSVLGEPIRDDRLRQVIKASASGAADAIGPDGVERIWSAAPVARTNAVLAVGLPKSEVLAHVQFSFVKSLVLTAGVGLLAALACWFGAELFLLRNIRALADGARRIGAGDVASPPKLPGSAGELRLIAEALGEMADQISARDMELQDSRRVLTEKTTLLEATLDHMDQGLLMVDAETIVQVCNRRAMELLNLPPELMLSRPRFGMVTRYQIEQGEFAGESEEFRQWALARGFDATHHVYERERPNGRVLEIRTVPLPQGGAVRTYTDITERKVAELRLAHGARHDALTDLPNRLLFRERLQQALARANRSDEKFAVLWLDLDHFKAVNDALGHPVGDALLVEVARRIKEKLRRDDVVARLGGDEFAILQTRTDQPLAAGQLGQRLVEALGEPFQVLDHQLHVGASVGVAIGPEDGREPDELLKNADLALYRAKADGRGVCRFFEPEMDASIQARRALELELRKAVAKGEFEVHYQPLVSTKTGTVTGFEALLRWRHPTRGLVAPAEFIPVAEDTRLIVQLGQWVLQEACREAASWDNELRISVNISVAQFAQPDLIESVRSALDASGLGPERLELEITETVLMRDLEASRRMFADLHALGVRVALDDFGTGYSSLSYLRTFPFDKIKIDRSFVKELATDPESLAIVRTIVSLGATLSMSVTAEGVETPEQYEFVRAIGCAEVQGFLLGKPKPASEGLQLSWSPLTKAA